MPMDVKWLNRRTLLLIHEKSIAEHGGLRGIRDEGLLDSALARPQQILHYNADVTLAQLAAAYVVGITRNHPFVDGNKRAAYVVLGLFLPANGWWLRSPQPEAYAIMMALAAGELTEEQLAAWIGQHIIPYGERR